MARRKRTAANGDGTIYPIRRGGKSGPIIGYRAQITLPDGRRKSISGKDKEDVKDRMTLVKADLVKGMPVPTGRQTVAEFMSSWLEIIRSGLRPSSHRRYRNAAAHIVDALGKTPLVDLKTKQVQEFYAKKSADGLKPKTVRGIHGVLHRALRDARDWDLVARNVTDKIRNLPHVSRHRIKPLTEEQIRQFLTACAGDRFEALYILAIDTGMRRGELLGLCWQDVDLEQGTLFVQTSISESRNQQGAESALIVPKQGTRRYTLAETKTDNGVRTIPLSRLSVEALKAHLERQKAERAKLGRYWQDHGLVFPNETGGLMIPDNFSKRNFKAMLKKAELDEKTRLHDLRHTAATRELARGIPVKEVSERLGHADPGFTWRTYSWVTPSIQRAAANVLDDIISGK